MVSRHCVIIWTLLCHSSCPWQFASVSSQRGARTPSCPCGPPSATPPPCRPWRSLSQQSSPSPPPFTTPSYIWSSSLISASPCVETWPCAGAHCVDVCVSTVQQRREPARNPITRRSAILPSCRTGCPRTTGPADTVRALKLSPAPGPTVQITAPSKRPGYWKDRSTARWLSVSCPTRCRATSSRTANAAKKKRNSQWDYWPGDADKEKTQGGEKGKMEFKTKIDCFISKDWKLLWCLKYCLKYILLPKKNGPQFSNPLQEDIWANQTVLMQTPMRVFHRVR